MRVTIEWERANRPAPAEATDQLNATRLDYDVGGRGADKARAAATVICVAHKCFF